MLWGVHAKVEEEAMNVQMRTRDEQDGRGTRVSWPRRRTRDALSQTLSLEGSSLSSSWYVMIKCTPQKGKKSV